MIAVGIDPGKTGAIAAVAADGSGHVYGVMDMPWKGTDVDVIQLQTWFRWMLPYGCRALIEKSQPFPQQGGKSNFTTGYGYGMLVATLLGEGVPFEAVAPVSWHKELKIPDGTDKAGINGIAARLYPGVDLGTRKDQGRSDALLIAECLRRRLYSG